MWQCYKRWRDRICCQAGICALLRLLLLCYVFMWFNAVRLIWAVFGALCAIVRADVLLLRVASLSNAL